MDKEDEKILNFLVSKWYATNEEIENFSPVLSFIVLLFIVGLVVYLFILK